MKNNKILSRIKKMAEMDEEEKEFLKDLEKIQNDAINIGEDFDSLISEIEILNQKIQNLAGPRQSDYIRVYCINAIKRLKQDFLDTVNNIE